MEKKEEHYVKKAERLAMEKEYGIGLRKLRERATRSNLPGKDNSNSTIKRTIRRIRPSAENGSIRHEYKKEGTTEACRIGNSAHHRDGRESAIQEKLHLSDGALDKPPVPDSANSFTGSRERCGTLDCINGNDTNASIEERLLACTYIMKELDAISKKSAIKVSRTSQNLEQEELFDQTSVDNRSLEDIILGSSGVSQGCDSHRDTETRPSTVNKFQNDTWTQLEFEKGENFGEKLVNKRVIGVGTMRMVYCERLQSMTRRKTNIR